MEKNQPPKFQSLDGRAKTLIFMEYLLIAVSAVAVVFGVMEFNLFNNLLSGAGGSEAELAANSTRQVYLGLTQLGIFLVEIIVFFVWYHRAYKNLPALGEKPKTTPAWAIIDFFIPIINLWEPYKRMREIWTGSVKHLESSAEKNSKIIGIWWILTLTSVLASRMLALYGGAILPEDLTGVTLEYVFADCLNIVLGVLMIIIVKKVTTGQKAGAPKEGHMSELHDSPPAVDIK